MPKNTLCVTYIMLYTTLKINQALFSWEETKIKRQGWKSHLKSVI